MMAPLMPLAAPLARRRRAVAIRSGRPGRIDGACADPVARGLFETHRRDLGYGLLLKRHVADPRMASPELIKQTAWDTVPNVPVSCRSRCPWR